jgi:hypothetical protein
VDVEFSMSGPCSGPLTDVVALGIKLVKEAIDKGDSAEAKRILDRTKRLPSEYALAAANERLLALQEALAEAKRK